MAADARPSKKLKTTTETSVNGVHPDRARAIEQQNGQKGKPTKSRTSENGVQGKHASILSKFSKSMQRSAAALAAAKDQPEKTDPIEEPRALHDLVPIPQPASEPTPDYKPSFSSLPDWLQKPVSVPAHERAPFTSLGVGEQTTAHLKGKGFSEAFAVQCALIPRLMYQVNHSYAKPNDICVSAPTGSGKTLGYALPIVEGLRAQHDERKLRAVIVVPTRELVDQAVSTFRKCMAGSKLKIGTSTGNKSFAEEQEALVTQSSRYDPEEDQQLMKKAGKRQRLEYDSDDEIDIDESVGTKADQLIKDALECEPGYVPTYSSAIDILVCTPGRLVEHLNNTLGFSLSHLDWLVIDEADRLLDQSFQDWVSVINKSLDVDIEDNVAAHYTPNTYWKRKRYVRKVILSATMTRDISQLEALKLRRPTMIVVRTEQDGEKADEAAEDVEVNDRGEYELPEGLSECAIPVGDGTEKPLYLLELLLEVLNRNANKTADDNMDVDSDSDSDSSSDSDTTSGSDSDVDSDSASDTEGQSSTDEDTSSESETSDSESSTKSSTMPAVKAATTAPPSTISSSAPQVLVFAASTSEAHRIHHLLTSLLPAAISPSPALTLLTKSHSTVGHTISAAKPRVIVSTDRASRGLDLPLSHVVNYTIPRSLESYVHRVGRTARAGRKGQAWSLVRDVEARWFWNEVGRATKVRRTEKVERRRTEVDKRWKDGEGKEAYRRVLEEMGRMVSK